ncbi:MAG: hypothetical protein E7662_11860 [Ruminococcaceae bacterium]|nr:hypothetical protein [Oscillospiraceae bacterium]
MPSYGEQNIEDISFFRIEKLSFDEKYPHREAFENVLASLVNRGFNFVYILQSESNGQVGIYIGIVKNSEQLELTASDIREIVQKAFRGNFSGSTLTKVSSDSHLYHDGLPIKNNNQIYFLCSSRTSEGEYR